MLNDKPYTHTTQDSVTHLVVGVPLLHEHAHVEVHAARRCVELLEREVDGEDVLRVVGDLKM